MLYRTQIYTKNLLFSQKIRIIDYMQQNEKFPFWIGDPIMKRSFRKILLTLLLSFALILSALPSSFLSASAASYGTSDRVVYVSANGSDSAAGTKKAPFKTLSKAIGELCASIQQNNGGTVVLMDDLTPDGSNALTGSIMRSKKYAKLLTFTGRDPDDGTIYPARLRYDGFGLSGPTKFEYLEFYPCRSSLHINTCGKPLIVGKGTSVGQYDLRFHDGIGETQRGTVSSTDTTIEGGSVGTVFVGGGYATDTANGVTGNCSLTVTGGHVGGISIGFDSYSAQHTDARIDGNVTITVSGEGSVGKISTRRIVNGTIGGALTVILNNNKTTSFESLPNAQKGVYRIFSGSHGRVEATDTVGSFRVIPNKGYYVLLDGERQPEGIYTFPTGDTVVQFVRGGDTNITENAYVSGDGAGFFNPDSLITRAEGVMMLYKTIETDEEIADGNAFLDVARTDWFYDGVNYFDHYGILPEDWVANLEPSLSLTRAEFIHMATLLYPQTTSSYKLSDFSDLTENNPYYEEMLGAYNEGKINGYGDGTLRPDAEITRAEAVTIVNRYIERKPIKQTSRFADVPVSHWANKQIAAASEALSSGYWEKNANNTSYVLPSSGKTEDAVKSLYVQSRALSADAIREGIDVISEQMKKTILNTTDTVTVTGTKYYVSEKSGNDTNDGKSPLRPIKTLSHVASLRLQSGDGVFFERGGIYRGSIAMTNGVTYAAYGTGEKPLLMQSRKNYADPSFWVATDYPNVWRCTDLLQNVGVIGFDHDLFDHSEDSYHELYGDILNMNTQGFTGLSDMNTDLQFYSDISGGVTSSGPLYVYSTGGNPGSRFSSIEIGERINIFRNGVKNVTVDNLAFKFTGAHAVGMGTSTNVVVRNCVFSWLGGSVLTLSSGGSAVNYGNAVEIYGGCDGYRVENCWMYQIYDTAVTHQRSSETGNCIQKGVRYLSNLMEYVHWGIEYYNAPPTAAQLGGNADTYTRITSDVYDAYNVLRMGGYGWGSITRFREHSARLYCGSTLSENYDELTEYNIFDRCAGYLLNVPSNSNEIDDKNIYVQTLGKTLGLLKGTYRVCTRSAHRDIADLFGDKNAVVIVTEE